MRGEYTKNCVVSFSSNSRSLQPDPTRGETVVSPSQPREYRECWGSRCVRQVGYHKSNSYHILADNTEIARSVYPNEVVWQELSFVDRLFI